jgi:hypothetical protein
MDKQVTKGQIGSIVALLVAGKVPHDDAQAFVDKYKTAPSKKKRKRAARDLIQVPDLSAVELIKLAQEKLGLTYLDPDYAKYAFLHDERGKTYEAKVWKPGREVVPATEVREHFTDGFVGNTAAFTAWLIKHDPEGYHASIPADDRLFQHGSSLCAPGFLRAESDRQLRLSDDVRYRWGGDCSFVAFREFKSA